jgi:hypothetical protein
VTAGRVWQGREHGSSCSCSVSLLRRRTCWLIGGKSTFDTPSVVQRCSHFLACNAGQPSLVTPASPGRQLWKPSSHSLCLFEAQSPLIIMWFGPWKKRPLTLALPVWRCSVLLDELDNYRGLKRPGTMGQ